MRWTEPWYLAYAIVGVMVLGVAPILIPVTVDAHGGTATAVGIVVAAFYVAALFVPVFGALADRTGKQRAVFLWCFPVMAATVAAFAFAEHTWQWALLALIFGGAGSLAGTVAGLFIVESHPKAEWDHRLSWFRMAYGAGQVAGLLLAAVTVSHLRLGWLITAGLLAAGLLAALIRLPHLHAVATHSDDTSRLTMIRALRGRFGIFLLTWLLTMTGVQTFFNVVPLIMRDMFSVAASTSSILFLIGAAIGTLVYPFCGAAAGKWGPGVVLAAGLILTLASFVAMTTAHAAHLPGESVIGSVALVIAAVAYAFNVVGATMIIVTVAPGSEGSAMGLLNGIIAAGAVIGAIAPSFVADALGYPALPALAAGIVLVALLVGIPLYRRSNWVTRSANPTPGGSPVPGA
ncbi:MFS transporter [Gordonia sp. NPDC003425]